MKSVSKILKQNNICGICNNKIDNPMNTYTSKFIPIPACEECSRKYSDEDLEIMLNMFLAYGGYFGQFHQKHFSLKKSLDNMRQITRAGVERAEEMNILLLHTALLHGIPPHQYFSELE
ncbi:MAG: hypothetical protein GF311_20075 [Candidatus Lokiarchaeota archaeon]|nr:hypothetical protein [Candidatus Lokiarchaeota archaeon]